MKALKLLLIIIVLFLLGFNRVKAQTAKLENYNPNVPKTLTYVVKAELGSNMLSDKLIQFFEVFDVEQLKNNNIYFLGTYSSKEKAELFMHTLNVSGISSTEIIAYFRQKKITLEDAITLSSNHNQFEETFVAIDVISIEELNELLDVSIHAAKFYYSLNVDVKDAMLAIETLQSLGSIYVNSFSDGAQYFSVGKFKSLDKIRMERENLIVNGCGDVFISAYLNGERISIDHAKHLEEIYNSTWITSMKNE